MMANAYKYKATYKTVGLPGELLGLVPKWVPLRVVFANGDDFVVGEPHRLYQKRKWALGLLQKADAVCISESNLHAAEYPDNAEWWGERGVEIYVDFDVEKPGDKAAHGLVTLVWKNVVARDNIRKMTFEKDLFVAIKGEWGGLTYVVINWRGTAEPSNPAKIEELSRLRNRFPEADVVLWGGDMNWVEFAEDRYFFEGESVRESTVEKTVAAYFQNMKAELGLIELRNPERIMTHINKGQKFLACNTRIFLKERGRPQDAATDPETGEDTDYSVTALMDEDSGGAGIDHIPTLVELRQAEFPKPEAGRAPRFPTGAIDTPGYVRRTIARFLQIIEGESGHHGLTNLAAAELQNAWEAGEEIPRIWRTPGRPSVLAPGVRHGLWLLDIFRRAAWQVAKEMGREMPQPSKDIKVQANATLRVLQAAARTKISPANDQILRRQLFIHPVLRKWATRQVVQDPMKGINVAWKLDAKGIRTHLAELMGRLTKGEEEGCDRYGLFGAKGPQEEDHALSMPERIQKRHTAIAVKRLKKQFPHIPLMEDDEHRLLGSVNDIGDLQFAKWAGEWGPKDIDEEAQDEWALEDEGLIEGWAAKPTREDLLASINRGKNSGAGGDSMPFRLWEAFDGLIVDICGVLVDEMCEEAWNPEECRRCPPPPRVAIPTLAPQYQRKRRQIKPEQRHKPPPHWDICFLKHFCGGKKPTGYTRTGIPYYSKKDVRALSVGQTLLRILEDAFDQRAAGPYERYIDPRQIAWLLHRLAHGNVGGVDHCLIEAVEEADEEALAASWDLITAFPSILRGGLAKVQKGTGHPTEYITFCANTYRSTKSVLVVNGFWLPGPEMAEGLCQGKVQSTKAMLLILHKFARKIARRAEMACLRIENFFSADDIFTVSRSTGKEDTGASTVEERQEKAAAGIIVVMDEAKKAEKTVGIRIGYGKCKLLSLTGKAPERVLEMLKSRGWDSIEQGTYAKYWGMQVGFKVPEEAVFSTAWERFGPRRAQMQEMGNSMRQKARLVQSHIDPMFLYCEGYREMPKKDQTKLRMSIHRYSGFSATLKLNALQQADWVLGLEVGWPDGRSRGLAQRAKWAFVMEEALEKTRSQRAQWSAEGRSRSIYGQWERAANRVADAAGIEWSQLTERIKDGYWSRHQKMLEKLGWQVQDWAHYEWAGRDPGALTDVEDWGGPGLLGATDGFGPTAIPEGAEGWLGGKTLFDVGEAGWGMLLWDDDDFTVFEGWGLLKGQRGELGHDNYVSEMIGFGEFMEALLKMTESEKGRRTLQKVRGVVYVVIDNWAGPEVASGGDQSNREPVVGVWLMQLWERVKKAKIFLIPLHVHSHQVGRDTFRRLKAANHRSDMLCKAPLREERGDQTKWVGDIRYDLCRDAYSDEDWQFQLKDWALGYGKPAREIRADAGGENEDGEQQTQVEWTPPHPGYWRAPRSEDGLQHPRRQQSIAGRPGGAVPRAVMVKQMKVENHFNNILKVEKWKDGEGPGEIAAKVSKMLGEEVTTGELREMRKHWGSSKQCPDRWRWAWLEVACNKIGTMRVLTAGERMRYDNERRAFQAKPTSTTVQYKAPSEEGGRWKRIYTWDQWTKIPPRAGPCNFCRQPGTEDSAPHYYGNKSQLPRTWLGYGPWAKIPEQTLEEALAHEADERGQEEQEREQRARQESERRQAAERIPWAQTRATALRRQAESRIREATRDHGVVPIIGPIPEAWQRARAAGNRAAAAEKRLQLLKYKARVIRTSSLGNEHAEDWEQEEEEEEEQDGPRDDERQEYQAPPSTRTPVVVGCRYFQGVYRDTIVRRREKDRKEDAPMLLTGKYMMSLIGETKDRRSTAEATFTLKTLVRWERFQPSEGVPEKRREDAAVRRAIGEVPKKKIIQTHRKQYFAAYQATKKAIEQKVFDQLWEDRKSAQVGCPWDPWGEHEEKWTLTQQKIEEEKWVVHQWEQPPATQGGRGFAVIKGPRGDLAALKAWWEQRWPAETTPRDYDDGVEIEEVEEDYVRVEADPAGRCRFCKQNRGKERRVREAHEMVCEARKPHQLVLNRKKARGLSGKTKALMGIDKWDPGAEDAEVPPPPAIAKIQAEIRQATIEARNGVMIVGDTQWREWGWGHDPRRALKHLGVLVFEEREEGKEKRWRIRGTGQQLQALWSFVRSMVARHRKRLTGPLRVNIDQAPVVGHLRGEGQQSSPTAPWRLDPRWQGKKVEEGGAAEENDAEVANGTAASAKSAAAPAGIGGRETSGRAEENVREDNGPQTGGRGQKRPQAGGGPHERTQRARSTVQTSARPGVKRRRRPAREVEGDVATEPSTREILTTDREKKGGDIEMEEDT